MPLLTELGRSCRGGYRFSSYGAGEVDPPLVFALIRLYGRSSIDALG